MSTESDQCQFKQHSVLDAAAFAPDDRVFGAICQRLGSANTPYDFNVIPIHILGSVYERFLGKVIIATDKRVRVEEKPEVRKAGGVYYTPEYVVRFIVDKTVGERLEGKTPSDVSKMRFADIACGSGSFLLGIYDTLLRYHGKYYNEHPDQVRKGDCETRDGHLYLSVRKKREILLNSVFGVDLDAQAVEVAQLSLFLRLLQDETPHSAHQYQMEFAHASKQQRLLPDLSGNVVRANSLIGPDYLRGQATFDGPADETDASPAAFEDLFPDVMRRGGFDAIVGNPPYVRIQGFPGKQVSYLREHYSAATGSFDIYVCFVEKALSLLRKSGGVGYILPNKFFTTDYGEGLRRILSAERALRAVVNFGVSQVFKATTYTCLLFLSKDRSAVVDYADAVADPNALAHLAWLPKSADSFAGEPWDFADDDSKDLLRKAATSGVRLLDLPASMSRGSSTGADDVFIVPHSADLEPGVLRTPVFAADFSRYAFEPTGEWRVIFPYEVYASGAEVFSEGQLRQRAPKVFSYLREHQAALKKRKQFREVHGFSAPRNLALHDRAAIAVPLLANGGLCALIPSEMHGTLCPMASGGFTIALGDGAPVSAEYVVGLLNSKLLYWMLMRTSNVFRGGWLTCTKQYFGELPIKLPLESDEVEVVRLVRDAVSARRKLRASRSDRDKDTHQLRCTSIDRELDECVYRLYALTPAEVALVERAVDVRGTPDDRASES